MLDGSIELAYLMIVRLLFKANKKDLFLKNWVLDKLEGLRPDNESS